MENPARKTDRTRWDEVHTAISDSDLARRETAHRRATARGTQPPSKFWHHAKWIAINVALIAATAYVYRYHLIPTFITPGMDQKPVWREGVGVEAARTNAANPMTAHPDNPPRLRRERSRLPPFQQPAGHQPATPALNVITAQEAKSLGYRCIGGVAYRVQVIDGVTHASADSSVTCAP